MRTIPDHEVALARLLLEEELEQRHGSGRPRLPRPRKSAGGRRGLLRRLQQRRRSRQQRRLPQQAEAQRAAEAQQAAMAAAAQRLSGQRWLSGRQRQRLPLRPHLQSWSCLDRQIRTTSAAAAAPPAAAVAAADKAAERMAGRPRRPLQALPRSQRQALRCRAACSRAAALPQLTSSLSGSGLWLRPAPLPQLPLQLTRAPAAWICWAAICWPSCTAPSRWRRCAIQLWRQTAQRTNEKRLQVGRFALLADTGGWRRLWRGHVEVGPEPESSAQRRHEPPISYAMALCPHPFPATAAAWIERQQAAGQAPCSPLTGVPLGSTVLHPNLMARKLVEACQQAGLLA